MIKKPIFIPKHFSQEIFDVYDEDLNDIPNLIATPTPLPPLPNSGGVSNGAPTPPQLVKVQAAKPSQSDDDMDKDQIYTKKSLGADIDDWSDADDPVIRDLPLNISKDQAPVIDSFINIIENNYKIKKLSDFTHYGLYS